MTQSALSALTSALQHERHGDHAAAALDYRTVLSHVADHPGAHLRLGQYAKARGDLAAARAHLTAATKGVVRLGLRKDGAAVFAELSALERLTGDIVASLWASRAGQAYCGEQPGLLWEECESLRVSNQSFDRLHRLNRLALLQPDDPIILANLGLALIGTASAAQAIVPLRRAVELGLQDIEITLALAGLEISGGDSETAITRLEQTQQDAPLHVGVLGLRWFAHQKMGQWPQAAEIVSRLLQRIEQGERHPALTPFMLLLSNASPALLYKFLQPNRANLPAVTLPAAATAKPLLNRTLRVGYLSADLHEHATAILMAGLFEQHDAERFEVFAYSYGPRVEDAYRTRLRAAIPNWRDLNDLADADAAGLIRRDDIDVLIELKGHTAGARLKIAAYRPAPVIIHYLGYPGTLTSEGIDYLVADETTVPFEHEPFYSETILRMPGSYQVNDQWRARPVATSRIALGLPDDAVVLCNFNQSSKWTERFFLCWLRVLACAPNAILWLLEPSLRVREILIRRASTMGVSHQIRWAESLSPTAHLARLAAADLALDQFDPVNISLSV